MKPLQHDRVGRVGPNRPEPGPVADQPALMAAGGAATILAMGLGRFRVESLAADEVHLLGSEAQHAGRVRRLRAGDEVLVFDGAGGEARGRIAVVRAGDVAIEIVERFDAQRPAAALDLAVAFPKGTRGDWLVEKTAELGVRAVIPLRTRRGVVVPSAGRLERWRRKCREAAKQSRSPLQMQVMPLVGPRDLAARSVAYEAVWLADPRPATPALVRMLGRRRPETALAIVGPEGGFTEEEARLFLTAGARAVRLAATILRTETAAVTLAALWAAGLLDAGMGDPGAETPL